ncbi:MAG: hypothetical protein RIS88_2681 [Pseudomonadota bacterium]
MAFALPLFAHLFDRAQVLRGAWLQPRPQPVGVPPPAVALAAAPADAPVRNWKGPKRLPSAQRTLRVVRVVEGRASGLGAGRMVISGRMADVCAELDRLAALETHR